MPDLYGRTARLTIAPIDGTTGIYITDLRIEFSVNKTGTSEPNKANIKIYNLSPA